MTEPGTSAPSTAGTVHITNAESLTARLKDFRTRLRPTEMRITTADGRIMKETISADGTYCTASVTDGSSGLGLGFIHDTKPDMQVGVIYENLLFGSLDVALDRNALQEHGVTHVLNVASGAPNVYPHAFTYKNLPLLDLPTTRLNDYLQDAFDFIDLGRRVGCVFVHCNAGVSRSAAIIIAYVMRSNEWDFHAAYAYVKEKRSCTLPNAGFTQQLKDLEYSAVCPSAGSDIEVTHPHCV